MVVASVTVHMWGADGRPSLISPESIALYWFLNGYYHEQAVIESLEIVFTNNTDLSPDEELPLLVYENSKISGFVQIVDYLTSELAAEKRDAATLLQSALLQFTTSELTVLTEYQLFLNKVNYETFTRKAFTQLLYWPMWYNTPLQYRAVARQKCEDILGYLLHEDDPECVESSLSSATTEPEELAQSKIFKVARQRKNKSKEELQNVKYNLQYLNRLSEHLKMWIQVRELAMSEKVIPADLLMWANIYVQLQLPDNATIATHLSKTLGTDFFTTLKTQLNVCSKFESIIHQRDPNFQEQGNVIMSLYNYVNKYL